MDTTNAVVWFEIYVDDMERAKNFYETVFTTTLEKLPAPGENDELEMMTFPNSGPTNIGAAGALVKAQGMKAGDNSVIVYFGSEDCSIEEARIKAAGGKVVKSKLSIGEYGFMLLATDTEGNMIGIHSTK